MKKILSVVTLLIAMLIATVGCSSGSSASVDNNIKSDLGNGITLDIKTTPKNQVETLSRVDYGERISKMYDKVGNFENFTKEEFYKEAIGKLSSTQKNKESEVQFQLLTMDKIVLEDLSKFTCENEEVANLHKKLISLYEERTNNRIELIKICIKNPDKTKIDSVKTLNEVTARNNIAADIFVSEERDLVSEIDNKLGIHIAEKE